MAVTSIFSKRDDGADPLRAALRVAIEAERTAELAVSERQAAIAKAKGLIEDSEREIEKVRGDIVAERGARVQAVAAELASGAAVPSAAGSRALRERLADCEDTLENGESG